MNRRTVYLLAALVVVAAAAAWLRPGRATDPPQPRGAANLASARPADPAHPRVNDAANILAPFGPRLGRMADAFLADLGVDVHVVTLDEKGAIEAQSERVFRERGIGANAPTGGILVLVNPAIRQARIEVGYSLEGGLTDLHMGRIARDQLAPYVSYAAAGMAVMDVLHYLRDQVYVAALSGDVELGEEFHRRGSFTDYARYYSGGAGARTKLSALPMDADFKKPVPPERRSLYAPSADVKESVAAYLRAAADLAGDPTLPLFTEGSRMMRAQFPLAPFEELKRLERIDASLPLEYRIEGDYAVATSANPAKGFVPILLRREGGYWRVDTVETWKNLFFDADGNYFLRNSNTPYRFGLGQFGEGRWYPMEQVPLGGRTIAEALAELESKGGLIATFWRAEIQLRNAFASLAALADYEKASRAAPKDPYVHEWLAKRAMYLGFPELAIPAFEVAGAGFELDLAEAWHEMGDAAQANRWVDRALAEDPYNLHALNWKKYLADEHGTPEEQQLARAAIALASSIPGRPVNPVWLAFEPDDPRLHTETTVQSDGVTVHDHSRFRVTMTNRSRRPVVIESVKLTSRGGSGAASGLGDVKGYWRYPSGNHRLGPGESIYFDKLWGFTIDTKHEYVRYTFRTCWHGLGETVRQCRTQWVDALP
jgi:uncharacterized protein